MSPPPIIIDPALPVVGPLGDVSPFDPAAAATMMVLGAPGAAPDDFVEEAGSPQQGPGDGDVIIISMALPSGGSSPTAVPAVGARSAVPQNPFSEALQRRLAGARRYPNTHLDRDFRRRTFRDMSATPVRIGDIVRGGRVVPDTLVGYPTDDGDEVWLLYALAPWGELRVGDRGYGVYHSSLFGPWQDIVAAGIMAVGGGTVVRIDLDSGHFLPDEEESLKLVRRVLRELGIPMSDDFLYDFATRP